MAAATIVVHMSTGGQQTLAGTLASRSESHAAQDKCFLTVRMARRSPRATEMNRCVAQRFTMCSAEHGFEISMTDDVYIAQTDGGGCGMVELRCRSVVRRRR